MVQARLLINSAAANSSSAFPIRAGMVLSVIAPVCATGSIRRSGIIAVAGCLSVSGGRVSSSSPVMISHDSHGHTALPTGNESIRQAVFGRRMDVHPESVSVHNGSCAALGT